VIVISSKHPNISNCLQSLIMLIDKTKGERSN
jgi:hypothetical protein